MNILRSGNKMSVSLQQGLAEFNIMRSKAVEGTKDMKGQDPKYFGISHRGREAEMFFPKESVTELDNQYGMDIATLVPSGTGTFDLLKPQFGARLNVREPKTVRNYLRKLLESL
jgi:hypothetical protein